MTKLREYREALNMSQDELAHAANVTARHIAFIENGKRNPSLDVALKISQKLNRPIEDIFLTPKSTNSTGKDTA